MFQSPPLHSTRATAPSAPSTGPGPLASGSSAPSAGTAETSTLAALGPASPLPATHLSPRPMGRPSGYSEETVGRLCEVIRRRGVPDTTAGKLLGIAASTLSGWKREHPELEEWLEMAREQFRDAKLAIVDEAKTADGRPSLRAAIWSLEKAFPQDYGKVARPARERAGNEADFRRSTAMLDRMMADELDEPAMVGEAGSVQSELAARGLPEVPAPARELIAVLLEENEALRAELIAMESNQPGGGSDVGENC